MGAQIAREGMGGYAVTIKRVLMACEFMRPGGYHNIAIGLAKGLAALGVDVTIIGRDWDGAEHDYPFTIIPSRVEYITLHTTTLAKELKPDWVLVMMDIPKIVSMFNNILAHNPTFNVDYNCAAIFPVESKPLGRPDWIAGLAKFRTRFTFTDFGIWRCEDEKLTAHKLPVGLDESWYTPNEAPRMYQFEWPYVLMVAQNQLRKNQWGAMMMAKFAEKRIVMVTGPENPDGWDLRKLAKDVELPDGHCVILNKDLVSHDQLRHLYAGAESLLLPSLAEGIGFPLYEAQAMGTPVVATGCCGIVEAVEGNGYIIPVQFITPYPWGNTHHYWPDNEFGGRLLRDAGEKPRPEIRKFPTWQPAADKLATVLSMLTDMGAKI